jgi:hypothetical protein
MGASSSSVEQRVDRVLVCLEDPHVEQLEPDVVVLRERPRRLDVAPGDVAPAVLAGERRVARDADADVLGEVVECGVPVAAARARDLVAHELGYGHTRLDAGLEPHIPDKDVAMPSDRRLITLSDLVRRASAIVDADGVDDAVTNFVARHEDDDEPVRAILDGLEERIAWGVDEDPSVVMAQALVLYLAHRLDEYEDDDEELLKLAARAEFDGHPPERITAWLADRGVELG